MPARRLGRLRRLARPALQEPVHLLRDLADPRRLDRRAGNLVPARIQLAHDRPAGDPRGDAGPLPGRRALRAVPLHPARGAALGPVRRGLRSEEHTSELQSLMRISYAVFCLKKKKKTTTRTLYSITRL